MSTNKIQWLPSTDEDIATYTLERAATRAGAYTVIATIVHDLEGADYDLVTGKFFYNDTGGSETSWYRMLATDGADQNSPYTTPFQITPDVILQGRRAELYGVWRDGVVKPEVEARVKPMLRITKGSDFHIVLTVDRAAGIRFNEPAGLVLTVRRKPYTEEKAMQLTGALLRQEGRGTWVFAGVPTTTRNMEWGRYVFDVWLTKDTTGEKQQVVAIAPFVLEPGAL